jgi:uncharacterized protein (TIGR00730 family)
MEENPEPLTFQELQETAKSRISLISQELDDGFDCITQHPRSITIFGSARTKENEHWYQEARRLSGLIVKYLKYSIITGGSVGIMEAGNRGAFESGGDSIGFTIKLPSEQTTNIYLTKEVNFEYFFTRKVSMTFAAEAYIYFPGGFGTLDEFFEILTLVQTGKIQRVPIILVGKEYWGALDTFIQKYLKKNKLIDDEDDSLYTITEDFDEVLDLIKKTPVRNGIPL